MRQDQALKILLSGRSTLLTGEPGAGKSHTIREFMKQTRRHVALTASTGIAATNIGGQTIHSWCGIGASQELRQSQVYGIRNGPAGRRIRAADTLVIDEISMLAGDTLQMVDYVCRTARGAYSKPFGGLQIIVGDFFQLPPVTFKQWRFAFENGLHGPISIRKFCFPASIGKMIRNFWRCWPQFAETSATDIIQRFVHGISVMRDCRETFRCCCRRTNSLIVSTPLSLKTCRGASNLPHDELRRTAAHVRINEGLPIA